MLWASTFTLQYCGSMILFLSVVFFWIPTIIHKKGRIMKTKSEKIDLSNFLESFGFGWFLAECKEEDGKSSNILFIYRRRKFLKVLDRIHSLRRVVASVRPFLKILGSEYGMLYMEDKAGRNMVTTAIVWSAKPFIDQYLGQSVQLFTPTHTPNKKPSVVRVLSKSS